MLLKSPRMRTFIKFRFQLQCLFCQQKRSEQKQLPNILLRTSFGEPDVCDMESRSSKRIREPDSPCCPTGGQWGEGSLWSGAGMAAGPSTRCQGSGLENSVGKEPSMASLPPHHLTAPESRTWPQAPLPVGSSRALPPRLCWGSWKGADFQQQCIIVQNLLLHTEGNSWLKQTARESRRTLSKVALPLSITGYSITAQDRKWQYPRC